MRALSIAFIALLAVASQGRANSIFDYGTGLSDATVILGADTFRIYVHKSRNTLLIQPAMKVILMGGGHFPAPTWRLVAERFVDPIGCGISDVRAFTKIGASWEATYVCPPGVDLRALVAAQRNDLKHGRAMHGGIPPSPSPEPLNSVPPPTGPAH